MKKQLITLVLLAWTASSLATVPMDTIPFWNIYYGRVIVIQGNINQTQIDKREIQIKKGNPWELIVTFNYDVGPPDKGELAIKQGGKTLRIMEYERGHGGHSRLPTNGGGSFFVVPLKEIIDVKLRNGRWELDFYYTDQRGQSNLKLGTILFKT